METTKDLNAKLKEEINAIFEELFKKIGNNRQQLANKVIGVHKDINKELNKSTVDAKRKAEILREVSAVEKMAAKQLPHLERMPAKPVAPAPAPTPEKAPVASSKPASPKPEKKAPATSVAKKKK